MIFGASFSHFVRERKKKKTFPSPGNLPPASRQAQIQLQNKIYSVPFSFSFQQRKGRQVIRVRQPTERNTFNKWKIFVQFPKVRASSSQHPSRGARCDKSTPSHSKRFAPPRLQGRIEKSAPVQCRLGFHLELSKSELLFLCCYSAIIVGLLTRVISSDIGTKGEKIANFTTMFESIIEVLILFGWIGRK